MSCDDLWMMRGYLYNSPNNGLWTTSPSLDMVFRDKIVLNLKIFHCWYTTLRHATVGTYVLVVMSLTHEEVMLAVSWSAKLLGLSSSPLYLHHHAYPSWIKRDPECKKRYFWMYHTCIFRCHTSFQDAIWVANGYVSPAKLLFSLFITLRPRQNGCHFADKIFQMHFCGWKISNFTKICSLVFSW